MKDLQLVQKKVLLSENTQEYHRCFFSNYNSKEIVYRKS